MRRLVPLFAALCLLLFGCSSGSGSQTKPSPSPSPRLPDKVWGVVDTNAKCHDDCYLPILAEPAAQDVASRIVNLGQMATDSPSCYPGVTGGCFPHSGQTIRVFCEKDAMGQADLWNDDHVVGWYLVGIPRQYWLNKSVGVTKGDMVTGWAYAGWLMPIIGGLNVDLPECRA